MLLRLSEAAVSTTYLLPFVDTFHWSGGDITLGMWEGVGEGGWRGDGEGGGGRVHRLEVLDI